MIERTHGGRVVSEFFDGRPDADFAGTSWSVYDEHAGLWRQTWVDDTGNYFALEGLSENGEMTLICDRHNAPDPAAVFRMRFTEIAADSFVWLWERAAGSGSSFELRWRIEYERVAPR